MTVAPYGSWPSPITPDVLVEQTVTLGQVMVDRSGAVWWTERRPTEGGRQVVVRDGVDMLPGLRGPNAVEGLRGPNAVEGLRGPNAVEGLPGPNAVEAPEFSARTRVHEYGGGDFAVHEGSLFFSNDADQRLWRVDPGPGGAGEPDPLTPDDGGVSRYADGTVSPDGLWIVCVRERHLGSAATDVVNDLVAVPTTAEGQGIVVLASGYDFFAAPRLSPDGRCLAFLAWDHPNMPWDGTTLWLREVEGGGEQLVAGRVDESISQPRWSPDSRLHWISDRTGWWNLYDQTGPLAPMDAEFAGPDWIFGESTYTFLADGRLVATWSEAGMARLGVVSGGGVTSVPTPFTSLNSLRAGAGSRVVAVAASPAESPAVVAIDVDTGDVRVIKPSRVTPPPVEALSSPRPMAYPSEGRTSHAFYYEPRLEGFEGPPGEKPPLLVRSHGGPTSAAQTALNLEIQFWTSRGFGVVDVDYGGSTGYGREYRRRLDGQWGIVDLDDCVNAARYLAGTGEVDPDRLVVRGGSAGGYTTLCALTFRDAFAAGASYYGVADLETLARDTHKFESRYLDRLIGPYPERRDLYMERSPIHAADRISAPVILLQGLEDKVVPPSQAEVLVDALRANRVPFAYVAIEGEQHGFRKAESIQRAVAAELSFYGQILGFEPAGDIEPVRIEHTDRLNAAKPQVTNDAI